MENQPLLAGRANDRRRHALTVASTGFFGAVVLVFFVVNANTMNRSTALIQKTKGGRVSLAAVLTPAQKREQETVECYTSIGVLGSLFCSPSVGGKLTQGLISQEASATNEVVHSLAPVSVEASKVPVVDATKIPADSETVKAVKTDDAAAPKAAAAPKPAQDAAPKSIKSDDGKEAEEAPIDCACCHSKCQKSGVYKDPKKKASSHSYWCVKQGQVGSPTYCPAQDYNCLCCDRVRVQLQGRSCA